MGMCNNTTCIIHVMCIIGSILYMYMCVRGRETKKEKGMLLVIMIDT